MADDFNFPSTGSAAEDARESLRIKRSNRFLELGECPNGCGQLIKMAEKTYKCPECGFVNFGREITLRPDAP